jgi:hypothetical protein
MHPIAGRDAKLGNIRLSASRALTVNRSGAGQFPAATTGRFIDRADSGG